jgi:hypothetical protein
MDDRRIEIQFPALMEVFLFAESRLDSGAYPASYAMDTVVSLAECVSTSHVHPVPRLGMHFYLIYPTRIHGLVLN